MARKAKLYSPTMTYENLSTQPKKYWMNEVESSKKKTSKFLFKTDKDKANKQMVVELITSYNQPVSPIYLMK
jgi:hypothetical protein